MNKKVFALLIVAFSTLVMTPLVNSQPSPPDLTVWTNKVDYSPGESGTLYIRFYNHYGGAITVEKVYIAFTAWQAYIKDKWEGNLTINTNQAVADKAVFTNETRFTVPNDGRAVNTPVMIIIETKERGTIISRSEACIISVPATPPSMNTIVTLLTVLLLLVVVCAVGVSMAIFLSARRPQVMWSKEEKTP